MAKLGKRLTALRAGIDRSKLYPVEEAVKMIKDRLEQHKITIRNIRHDALKGLKDLKGKSGVGEDAEKKAETDVNDLTKKYEGQLDAHFEKRSKDIMTV